MTDPVPTVTDVPHNDVYPRFDACNRCTQGVLDADRILPNGAVIPGNDHLYGRCRCSCHDVTSTTRGQLDAR